MVRERHDLRQRAPARSADSGRARPRRRRATATPESRRCAFYEGVTIEDGIFVPIGNDGWYHAAATRARYTQQPLEACALVDAELAAFDRDRRSRPRGYGRAWPGIGTTARTRGREMMAQRRRMLRRPGRSGRQSQYGRRIDAGAARGSLCDGRSPSSGASRRALSTCAKRRILRLAPLAQDRLRFGCTPSTGRGEPLGETL